MELCNFCEWARSVPKSLHVVLAQKWGMEGEGSLKREHLLKKRGMEGEGSRKGKIYQIDGSKYCKEYDYEVR